MFSPIEIKTSNEEEGNYIVQTYDDADENLQGVVQEAKDVLSIFLAHLTDPEYFEHPYHGFFGQIFDLVITGKLLLTFTQINEPRVLFSVNSPLLEYRHPFYYSDLIKNEEHKIVSIGLVLQTGILINKILDYLQNGEAELLQQNIQHSFLLSYITTGRYFHIKKQQGQLPTLGDRPKISKFIEHYQNLQLAL